ncbi:MAG: tetratricopeptide repeat protein [Gemmatimonadota bacterium]
MRDRIPGGRGLPAWSLVAVLALAASGCGSAAGDALARGDRMLAAGNTQEAVAEYLLAARQRGESPEVLARLADAYARQGEVEETIRYVDRLLAADSSYRHEAAAVLLGLARDAREAGERDRMVRALSPVTELGVDLIPARMRLALAEAHWERDEHERALPLYLSVVEPPDPPPLDPAILDSVGREARQEGATPGGDTVAAGAEAAGRRDTASLALLPDSASSPAVLYHVGRSYEELGSCAEALPYFRAYLSRRASGRRTAERTTAEWHYGSCLYAVAQRERRAGENEAALAKLTRLIELGVPRTLMDRAHFARGSVYGEMGRNDLALEEFDQVLRLNPARSGPLVQMAEQRIREIRYGTP